MPLYSRRTNKPPQGTLIDRAHGLVGGLQGFYALNEGAGSRIVDAANNTNLLTAGYGNTNPWRAGSSIGLDGTVNLGLASAIIPPALQCGYPITIACGIRRIANEAGQCRFFGLAGNNTFAAPQSIMSFLLPAAQAITLELNPSGSLVTKPTGYTPAANVDVVLAFTLKGFDTRFYANGVRTFTDTSFGLTAPFWLSTSSFYFGGMPGATGTRSSGCVLYWGAWWARSLSDKEHALIGSSVESIWEIFKPPQTYWFAGAPPGPVSATMAATETADARAMPAKFTTSAFSSQTTPGDTTTILAKFASVATMARTEAFDSRAMPAKFTAPALMARTAGTDTLTGVAVFASVATMARTEGADARSMPAVFKSSATLAWTNVGDTAAIVATSASGVFMSGVGRADVLAALATTAAPGALSRTEGHDLLAALGTTTAAATMARAAGSDVMTSVCISGSFATASPAERHDLATIVAHTAITATAATTERHDTMTSVVVVSGVGATARVRIEWAYPSLDQTNAPTGFHVYLGTTGTPSYASPVATVLFSSMRAGSFVADLTGLVDGLTYAVGVRAFNGAAEEPNTDFVLVKADSTGPNAVQSLAGAAI